MKVLMLHNRYKIMGGEDVSTEAEYTLLKQNGINIENYYVNNNKLDKTNKLLLAANTIWSNHYYKEILKKIKTEKYDIIHVQNFFPLLSPSIFHAAHKAGTKIVMSIRNYRLICPNALMYVNNNICTECVGKTIPYPAISKKCYRESYSATGVTVAMLSFHNIIKTWKTKIDGLICISEFVKSQLILGGFDPKQLYVKHNFVSSDISPNYIPEDYYIYVGRLSIEKGIDVLLKSFEVNNKKLIIIGDGPLQAQVINSTEKNSNISYLGKLSLEETYLKISKAKALIFPSKWHEPFGRTIVESFAHGTPVIGSSLGGVSELIQDTYNGFLFDPYIDGRLNSTIESFENVKSMLEIRQNSYMSYQNHFTPAINFEKAIEIYNHVLNS